MHCARTSVPATRCGRPGTGPPSSRSPLASDPLTAREREIVALLRAGLTNAEIAVRLSIAPGTVRRHLENVYGKLGVHTRTAALAKLRLA